MTCYFAFRARSFFKEEDEGVRNGNVCSISLFSETPLPLREVSKFMLLRLDFLTNVLVLRHWIESTLKSIFWSICCYLLGCHASCVICFALIFSFFLRLVDR